MTSSWQNFLVERGARMDADGVAHFGDAAGELRAACGAGIVAPLFHLGVIECAGVDAKAFLHGQLSSDVGAMPPAQSQYAAYCSAKGRMLANFLLWREDAAYCLQLASSLLPAVKKRLAMYVLRSKVVLSDATESRPVFGIAGSAAAEALHALFSSLPQNAHDVVRDPDIGTLIALPGERYQLIAAAATATQTWQTLAARLTPAGSPCWEWLEIRNGIPLLTPATQEQFVPQMANMELLGAVSFRKGCYPGQEIVARTQHLGQVKRRMYLAHAESEGVPLPGTELFDESGDTQSIGMVVNAQAAPGGGCDLLAVLQTTSAENSIVHLGSRDGETLAYQPLPYAL